VGWGNLGLENVPTTKSLWKIIEWSSKEKKKKKAKKKKKKKRIFLEHSPPILL